MNAPIPTFVDLALTADFAHTGLAGEGWMLQDDGTSLELVGNGSPIAYIPLDIYEENDFGQAAQALANAQLFLKAPQALAMLKLCEVALRSGDSQEQQRIAGQARSLIQEITHQYTGPIPAILAR